jgi:hypothetical protein
MQKHTQTRTSALGNTEAFRLVSEARTQKRNQGKVLAACMAVSHQTSSDNKRQITQAYKAIHGDAPKITVRRGLQLAKRLVKDMAEKLLQWDRAVHARPGLKDVAKPMFVASILSDATRDVMQYRQEELVDLLELHDIADDFRPVLAPPAPGVQKARS